MKQVFICGDSFGTHDPEYSNESWTDQLSVKLINNASVINLSRVCASNLHIALQIDTAIAKKADFIIYLATSSTREVVKLRPIKQHKQLLNRIVDITNPTHTTDLTSYSYASLDNTTLFNNTQLLLLKQYHSEFFDIDVAVYNNQLIIESVLSKLVDSNIPFLFDQGGFEHRSFLNSSPMKYFKKYSNFFSDINLWDFVINQPQTHRPYYHIKDISIHTKIANYYYNKIIN
jgi:protein-tyrosine-phosphatase